jgi:hypothetical protein
MILVGQEGRRERRIVVGFVIGFFIEIVIGIVIGNCYNNSEAVVPRRGGKELYRGRGSCLFAAASSRHSEALEDTWRQPQSRTLLPTNETQLRARTQTRTPDASAPL